MKALLCASLMAMFSALPAAQAATCDQTAPSYFGHRKPIQQLSISMDRVLSVDVNGHWLLWDMATRHPLAGGGLVRRNDATHSWPYVIVSDPLFLLEDASGIHIKASETLKETGKFLRPSDAAQFGVFRSNAIVWSADANSLNLYDATGKITKKFSGDFSKSAIVADYQTIGIVDASTTGGTVRRYTPPMVAMSAPTKFVGHFAKWLGYERTFATIDDQNVRVYANSGELLSTIAHGEPGGWEAVTVWGNAYSVWIIGASHPESVAFYSAEEKPWLIYTQVRQLPGFLGVGATDIYDVPAGATSGATVFVNDPTELSTDTVHFPVPDLVQMTVDRERSIWVGATASGAIYDSRDTCYGAPGS